MFPNLSVTSPTYHDSTWVRALLTDDDVNQDAESTFKVIRLFVSKEVAYYYDPKDEKYNVEYFEVKALQGVRDALEGARGPYKYHILV